MIEDKIQLILKDLQKVKDDLKDVRKDIKAHEKIETEEYLSLRKATKEMKQQLKDYEENANQSLKSDETYNKLRELKVSLEEQLANKNKALFEEIYKLPPKPWQVNMETEEGPVKIQVIPDMKLFLNGREERKRV